MQWENWQKKKPTANNRQQTTGLSGYAINRPIPTLGSALTKDTFSITKSPQVNPK
jgi:hypothetical protein